MVTTLQQTPITFQSRSPFATQLQSKPTIKFHLSLNMKFLKLSIKPLVPHHRGRAFRPRMSDTIVENYANALTDVAKSNNALDQTSVNMEKLEKIFFDDQVFNFFTNPTINLKNKRKIVDEILKSSSLQPQVVNFLNMLLDKKQIDQIKEILKEFEVVHNKLTQTKLATVTSVVSWSHSI